MSRIVKLLTGIVALGSLVIFNAACGTEHAKIRFVHASPDAGVLDVALDGKNVATALAFGDVSPATGYLTIASGNHKVEVRDSTTKDRINSTIDFANQKEYTLLAIELAPPVPPPPDTPASITALLKTDDNSAPPSGNVKLRVIHSAEDPTEVKDGQTVPVPVPVHVDVYVVASGTDISNVSPTIAALGYQQASNYLSVPAATYEFIVTTSGTKTRLVDQPYDFAAGQIRTLVTVDISGGGFMSGTPLVLSDAN